MTQTNLGTALQTLGERGDDAALLRAAAAFEAALTVRTRQTDPRNWSQIQIQLAVVHGARFTRGGGRDRRAAAAALSAARAALSGFQQLGDTKNGQAARNIVNALTPMVQ
jgi:hypothetical protein